MSLRLKNEATTFPPGGLQFHERQLNWKNWINDPTTVWSWDNLVIAVYNLRRANAARFPKLSTDRAVIRRQISEQNANRIASMPGAETYLASAPIAVQGAAAPNPQVPHNEPSPKNVVGRIALLAKGAATLLDWWTKDQGQPVPHELAEKRAAICVECPMNNMEGVDAWFTKPAAALIKRKMEARKDLNLTTSLDDKLGTCEGCLCQLSLSVHTPKEVKLKHMSEETKASLWSACWLKNE